MQDKRVTIVVPVYDDWQTLEGCIRSLKKYVDRRHTILLMNDMGPNWEYLDAKIREAIEGTENFIYEKNEKNLGFVKTCNKAVMESDKSDNDILLLNSDTAVTENFLEEMLEVLYITEKHGAVVPRSNCATIYTVPFRKDASVDLTPESSHRVYENVKDLLPRYSVMPTGVGYALLIKRHLIKNYGLFDEIYSPGYNEENDFCMRINQYGYNIVSANRAYVYHYESKSFGSKRNELDQAHSAILQSRYPYYIDNVRLYTDYRIDPVEHFADVIGGLYEKKRILIDLYEVPCAYNGTAQYGLSFLNNFYELYKDKYEIDVLTNDAADRFHKIGEKYPRVFYPHTITKNYDIAYAPSQIIHVEHLHLLNRICYKIIFCMQDIISIRSSYLLTGDWEREGIFREAIRYSDGIVFISGFSEEETRTYYPDEFEGKNKRTRVVYHGRFRDNEKEADEISDIPFDKYIVVLGNHYKHKNLENVMPELEKSKHNYVIIGNPYTGIVKENIYGLRTGNLTDEYLRGIYKKAEAILFPSVYEGFGLPILTAIDYGKTILVNDNSLNRELISYFDKSGDYIDTFNSVCEIEEKLDRLLSIKINKKPDEISSRDWKDVAVETEGFISEVLNSPSNISLLRERWERLQYESRTHRCYLPGSRKETAKEKLKHRLASNPKLYSFLKKIKTKIKG